jgi:hypothetical protein
VIGCIAICFAAAIGVAPASLAENQGRPAGTGKTVVSVAVPSGKVRVGAEHVDGAPVYVRRTTGIEGMTVVEVSTSPFMPVMRSNGEPAAADKLIANPAAQPASW